MDQERKNLSISDIGIRNQQQTLNPFEKYKIMPVVMRLKIIKLREIDIFKQKTSIQLMNEIPMKLFAR